MKALCSEMCPVDERQMRQAHGLVHPLETDEPWKVIESSCNYTNSTNGAYLSGRRRGHSMRPEANPSKMVKCYSRSAADKSIRLVDIRTFNTLSCTVDYLLNNVVTKNQTVRNRWPVVYAFVVDRFRAIRQDMTVQELPPAESCILLEKMIPSYLQFPYMYSSDGSPPAVGSIFFDRKLHSNELEECFSKWKTIVDDYGIGSLTTKTAYLLYHCDRAESLVNYYEWRKEFDTAAPKLGHDVYALLLAYRLNNFVVFFRRMAAFRFYHEENDKAVSSSLHFAVLPFVPLMRRVALASLFAAYGAPNVRLAEPLLIRWLAFVSANDLRACLADMTGKAKDGVLSEMCSSTRNGSHNDNDDDKMEEICVKFHGFRLQDPNELNKGFNLLALGAHWHRIA